MPYFLELKTRFISSFNVVGWGSVLDLSMRWGRQAVAVDSSYVSPACPLLSWSLLPAAHLPQPLPPHHLDTVPAQSMAYRAVLIWPHSSRGGAEAAGGAVAMRKKVAVSGREAMGDQQSRIWGGGEAAGGRQGSGCRGDAETK